MNGEDKIFNELEAVSLQRIINNQNLENSNIKEEKKEFIDGELLKQHINCGKLFIINNILVIVSIIIFLRNPYAFLNIPKSLYKIGYDDALLYYYGFIILTGLFVIINYIIHTLIFKVKKLKTIIWPLFIIIAEILFLLFCLSDNSCGGGAGFLFILSIPVAAICLAITFSIGLIVDYKGKKLHKINYNLYKYYGITLFCLNFFVIMYAIFIAPILYYDPVNLDDLHVYTEKVEEWLMYNTYGDYSSIYEAIESGYFDNLILLKDGSYLEINDINVHKNNGIFYIRLYFSDKEDIVFRKDSDEENYYIEYNCR